MSNDKSIDINVFSSWVEAEADIRQSWDVILHTVPGSDPMRPNFGSNIYQFIDRPVNDFSGKFAAQVIEDLERWETRCTISKVSILVSGKNIEVSIEGVYTPTGDVINATLTINIPSQNAPINKVGSYSESYSESYNQ